MTLLDCLNEHSRLVGKRLALMPAEANSPECWNILLDLAQAQLRRRRISITSACIASGAPATTALRHIALLEAHGLAERSEDPDDSRRKWLGITDAGFAIVHAAFQLKSAGLHTPARTQPGRGADAPASLPYGSAAPFHAQANIREARHDHA